jgi:hypothetical protein
MMDQSPLGSKAHQSGVNCEKFRSIEALWDGIGEESAGVSGLLYTVVYGMAGFFGEHAKGAALK